MLVKRLNFISIAIYHENNLLIVNVSMQVVAAQWLLLLRLFFDQEVAPNAGYTQQRGRIIAF